MTSPDLEHGYGCESLCDLAGVKQAVGPVPHSHHITTAQVYVQAVAEARAQKSS
ncbi:hypothetical protein DPMN_128430 [Dreissena polymorpha]|uniref:Uncharacterized protein n=1 Tax=Dreissena polymorpha TaxID=45954 RepID=A0A9D4GZH8_DREPO|nr:hypothetical protein DPMN_128430 [Dreissena polymorpha]